MATIYCMRCGAPLQEGASYCTECGSPTSLGLRQGEERRAAAAERIERERAGVDGGAYEGAAHAVEPSSEAEVTLVVVGEARDVGAAADSDARAAAGAEAPHGSHFDMDLQPQEGVHIDPLSTGRKGRRGDGRRTALLGVAAALLTFVVVLGAAYAAGFLGTHPGAGPAPTATDEPTEAPASEPISLEVRPSLPEYSWSELSTIAKAMSAASTRDEAMELARTYHLVDEQGALSSDTKEVTIIGVGTMHMRLVGIWHDDLANSTGKAGLSFLADDLLFTHRMRETDDNQGGWEQSDLRHWLNVDICNSLNDDLRTSIVAVDKLTNNVGKTTDVASVTLTLDKLWVPSVVEVVGPIDWTWDSDVANSALYNDVMNAEGEQYEYFAGMDISQSYGNEELIRRGENGSIAYWLRSSSASKDQHFRTVDAYGNPVRWAAATDELGVCVGFCL